MQLILPLLSGLYKPALKYILLPDAQHSEQERLTSQPVAEILQMCLQVGTSLAVDLTAEEEFCSTAALQVAVNASGSICSANMRGSKGVSPGIVQVSWKPLL